MWYKPCCPGIVFSTYRTGLCTFSYLFVLLVLSGTHSAEPEMYYAAIPAPQPIILFLLVYGKLESEVENEETEK
jgi:hypothetical protein